MNQCVSTMVHATHNNRESVCFFLQQYGRYVNKTWITPLTQVKERQDILPSMNGAVETWMTTELKYNLPMSIMALFLPLNAENNSVPITVHGFNNRSIDMHQISTPRQGWHSFDETIKGEKQGSFDAKITVSFFQTNQDCKLTLKHVYHRIKINTHHKCVSTLFAPNRIQIERTCVCKQLTLLLTLTETKK
jgi:hypothetical protein